MAFDGTSSGGVKYLYIPIEDDEQLYEQYGKGIFLKYYWDKFSFDSEGDCVLEYLNEDGGLEGTLWDISTE